MTVPELEEWLETKESKESGTGVGHDSGERIVEILKTYGDKPKSVDEYDEEDLKHMRKVSLCINFGRRFDNLGI